MKDAGCRELWTAVIERALLDCAESGRLLSDSARLWLSDDLYAGDRSILSDLAGFDIETWRPKITKALSMVDKKEISANKYRGFVRQLLSRHADIMA